MKNIPMRKCIACMESKPKKELLRIVRISDNEIKFDSTGKLNGRGMYVCSMTCLNKAIKTKRIDKIFEIHVSDENYTELLQDIDAYTK